MATERLNTFNDTTGDHKASTAGNWSTGVVPGQDPANFLDRISVPSAAGGRICQWDVPTATLYSDGTSAGHAFNVGGSSASSYGQLEFLDGTVIDLQGDAGSVLWPTANFSNGLMGHVNRFGKLICRAGSTIRGLPGGNYTSGIKVLGTLVVEVQYDGTGLTTRDHIVKGVTFTSPTAAYSWANASTAENPIATAGPGSNRYTSANALGVRVGVAQLAHDRVSNLAATGEGTVGDTSFLFVSFSLGGVSQMGNLTAKSSVDALQNAGDYYLNHNSGTIYFANPTGATPAFVCNYQYLKVTRGWGIDARQNTDNHAINLDGATFTYMGGTGGALPAVYIKNKHSAGSNTANGFTDRTGWMRKCATRWCNLAVVLDTVTGTVLDPFRCEGNAFYSNHDSSYGAVVTLYDSSTTNLSISNNAIDVSDEFVRALAVVSSRDHAGFKMTGNTGAAQSLVYNSSAPGSSTNQLWVTFSDAAISGNSTLGYGCATDLNYLISVGGTAGHEAIIEGNTHARGKRCVNLVSHARYRRNNFSEFWHHSIIAGSSAFTGKIENVRITANLLPSFGGDNPSLQLGYVGFVWIDDVHLLNNTLSGGGIEFGDTEDNAGVALVTRSTCVNNLTVNADKGPNGSSSKAYAYTIENGGWRGRVHLHAFECNAFYPAANSYGGVLTRQVRVTKGGVRYNDLDTTSRNVPGVALFNPSEASPLPGGKALSLVVATDLSAAANVLNATLAWGGGTPVQLKKWTGTVTAATGSTVTDSAQAWSTARTNANCPQALWLYWMPGSVNAGTAHVIVANTATQLTTATRWAATPAVGDKFVIVESMVTLTASDANTVIAGVYLPDLLAKLTVGAGTFTDSGITWTAQEVSANPSLPNLTLGAFDTTPAHYVPSSGSPLVGAGVALAGLTPATDYLNLAYRTTPTIGAFEAPQSGASFYYQKRRRRARA